MKKHKRAIPFLILIIVLVVLFFNFVTQDEKVEQVKKDVNLYYISKDGLSFYQVPYQFEKAVEPYDKAMEILEELKKVPKNEKCQQTIPQDVVWTNVILDGNNLVIDFATSYSKMNSAQEIFLRTGIVKSLVQVPGIVSVEFKVNGMPLMNTSDQPVGMMDADRFIDGTEENWGVNTQEKMILYYANETGDALVERPTTINVVNNIPLEQLIIEALLAQPQEDGGYFSPIPEETKVIKTVTKDEICYVDLSKEFLDPMENVTAEISVYSIVNSLIEKENVNKVQFSVEGQTITSFRETMDLSLPFDRNLDLVEPDEAAAK